MLMYKMQLCDWQIKMFNRINQNTITTLRAYAKSISNTSTTILEKTFVKTCNITILKTDINIGCAC